MNCSTYRGSHGACHHRAGAAGCEGDSRRRLRAGSHFDRCASSYSFAYRLATAAAGFDERLRQTGRHGQAWRLVVVGCGKPRQAWHVGQAFHTKVPTNNKLWVSMALVGALQRCPPLAAAAADRLALRRAGRLAPHPARTISISTIYSWWVLRAYSRRPESPLARLASGCRLARRCMARHAASSRLARAYQASLSASSFLRE
jgi:hypothetical protein